MTNKTNEKSVIINKIINQANSLNKKIKNFKDEGITDHFEFVQAMFNDKQMIYNESGSLTKSKKFYNNQNLLELKRTLNILTKINNHEVFGTTRKYKKFATESWTTLQHTVKEVLRMKGYSDSEINSVVTTKDFYNSLLIAFKDIGRGYGSEQVIEKVFLQYSSDTLCQDDIEKAVSDIEFSVSKQRELTEHIRDYEEYMKWKQENKRGRR